MIRCDWCKGENVRDTGGTEWTGNAIYVCETPGCGHEWTEISIRRPKGTYPDFLDGMETIVEEFKKENG